MAKRAKNNGKWSQLPPDLVGAILNRFDEIEHVVTLSAVCTSWRSSVLNHRWNPRVPQLPWLMFTGYMYTADKCRRFWNLRKKNHYIDLNLPIDIMNNAKGCYGSSIGWVFIHGNDCTTRLINPLTRSQIPLPPLLPNQFVEKAFVFETPSSLVAMAILYRPYRLALARPGFTEWVTVQDHDHQRWSIRDVVCYKGRVFAVRFDGALVICEIDGVNPRVTNFAPPPPRKNPSNYYCYGIYLIESDGDLLMAFKYYSFKVFKFNLDTLEWTELKELGNRALLLGNNNYSMSVCTTNDEHCRSNCIYYTSLSCCKRDTCFLSIFHMKDHTKECYFISNVSHISRNPPPLWVMPSLS